MIYLFFLAHLVADFILQPFWLVKRKQRWSGLFIHGTIVLACMLLLALLDVTALQLWPAMLAITIVHFFTDRWKVRHADHMLRPPIVPFCVDQVIHFVTIVVALSCILSWTQIWHLSGSHAALLSVYASVYVTAAFAVPIAVMVWLDPAFTHGSLAKGARIRGVMAAAAVISLTLVGGLVALPATLLGFAVVARHPVSRHPLDTPVGLFTILTTAATLAIVLVFFCK